MKKKIKDFTIGEAQEICNKTRNCEKCPFWFCVRCIFKDTTIENHILEQEKEVENE